MDWDAIGAIAEHGGAISVIATLFYLALQIRRSASAGNANAYYDLVNGWHHATALLLEPSNRATFMKALDGYDDLTDDERFQFHILAAQVVDRFESMLQFRFLGVTDRVHPAEQYTPFVADLMSNVGFQRFWQAEQVYFSPQMKRWIEEHCPDAAGSSKPRFAANIVKRQPVPIQARRHCWRLEKP